LSYKLEVWEWRSFVSCYTLTRAQSLAFPGVCILSTSESTSILVLIGLLPYLLAQCSIEQAYSTSKGYTADRAVM